MNRVLIVMMMMFVAFGTAAAQPPSNAKAIRDSTELRKRLERQAAAFLELWQIHWKRSSRDPVHSDEQNPAGPGAERLRNLHCHWDGSYHGVDGKRNPGGAQASLIRSRTTSFSVCPDWSPERDSSIADAGNAPDAMLSATSVSTIAAARRRLTDSLQTAAHRLPQDAWVAGQRVRFLLDAQDHASAMAAADECRASRAWCAGLTGLVHAHTGDVVAADSVFAAMLMHMDDTVRCELASILPLVEPREQQRYTSLDCAQQARANTNFWWLADPMYAERGNERRVEHFARRLRLALHTALPDDALWKYRNTDGGDAIKTMLIRYGWPSRSWWGGAGEDARHTGWLKHEEVEPYSVPEYSLSRIATSPTWDAVIDPMTTSNGDFVLSAPANLDQRRWWPREHFRSRAGTIVDVDEGQVALFRRDTSTMYVLAARVIGDQLVDRVGERVHATVVWSPVPDSVVVLANQRIAIGARMLARASLDSGTGMTGVEMAARDSTVHAARSRFGLVVPASLNELPAGSRALSLPVLFQVPGEDMPMPDDVNSVVEQMYASLRIASPARLGVFWESYGFQPSDTVTITVSMQRITRPGRWQRIGIALGLADEPNSAVSLRWTEPRPGRTSTLVAGTRPILGRQLVMNVANLVAGDYRLAVTMEPRSGTPVTNERVFIIRR